MLAFVAFFPDRCRHRKRPVLCVVYMLLTTREESKIINLSCCTLGNTYSSTENKLSWCWQFDKPARRT